MTVPEFLTTLFLAIGIDEGKIYWAKLKKHISKKLKK